MAAFIQLDDSPMFRKQIYSLEQTAEELRDRCHRLYKGCSGFMAAPGESCRGDTLLANSMEAFGAGQDDAISVSIGGPVISKFVSTFHELASYKELLRSQVEHVLVDRLNQLITIDLQGVKESRRQLDKAMYAYDQARERFVSLKKSTREDIISELEEDLQNSKSAFERSRFNLVNALMNVEAKKKYEFLESFSAIMDAHMRYFKLGYDLLSQMEPFIHQVLTYAQQSKEMANIEQDKLAKRIQEFRTQAEMDSLRASSAIEPSAVADGVHFAGTDSYKSIEAIMQSTRSGQVQTIKQGYLLKRSSSLRGDWKRRFFVLDSQGAFYYHKNNGTKLMGSQPYYSGGSIEHNGVFGRFRSKYSKALPNSEGSLGCKIVDLHTSTIKLDADDSDLRLCFRIISPAKTYTLQAENEADRMDWMNKTKAVIASLFNSHFLQQPTLGMGKDESNTIGAGYIASVSGRTSFKDSMEVRRPDAVAEVLRTILGNDLCAECCSPQPDWASLNLGILLCIECSGLHRNLGVHISKVRSITLDVKVWEPSIVDLFCSLGNIFCNSIWEGKLLKDTTSMNDLDIIGSTMPITKLSPNDAVSCKEKYIHAKYVEKLLVVEDTTESSSQLKSIWQAVETSNLQEAYRFIVTSKSNIINTIFDEIVGNGDASPHVEFHSVDPHQENPTDCERIKASREPCLQGCSLLHLACQHKNLVMVELLLQFGADINMQDFHKRTPLHHCISMGNNSLAKFLLRRGARPSIKDDGGFTALERAMEMGAITDEELFILLAEGK